MSNGSEAINYRLSEVAFDNEGISFKAKKKSHYISLKDVDTFCDHGHVIVISLHDKRELIVNTGASGRKHYQFLEYLEQNYSVKLDFEHEKILTKPVIVVLLFLLAIITSSIIYVSTILSKNDMLKICGFLLFPLFLMGIKLGPGLISSIFNSSAANTLNIKPSVFRREKNFWTILILVNFFISMFIWIASEKRLLPHIDYILLISIALICSLLFSVLLVVKMNSRFNRINSFLFLLIVGVTISSFPTLYSIVSWVNQSNDEYEQGIYQFSTETRTFKGRRSFYIRISTERVSTSVEITKDNYNKFGDGGQIEAQIGKGIFMSRYFRSITRDGISIMIK